jgi:hypothetical protein
MQKYIYAEYVNLMKSEYFLFRRKCKLGRQIFVVFCFCVFFGIIFPTQSLAQMQKNGSSSRGTPAAYYDNDEEYRKPAKARQSAYQEYHSVPSYPATGNQYYEDSDKAYQYPTYAPEEDNPSYAPPPLQQRSAPQPIQQQQQQPQQQSAPMRQNPPAAVATQPVRQRPAQQPTQQQLQPRPYYENYQQQPAAPAQPQQNAPLDADAEYYYYAPPAGAAPTEARPQNQPGKHQNNYQNTNDPPYFPMFYD